MSHHFWPYAIDADEAPPLDADRYLVWLARHQWRTILGGVLFGVPWMLSIALVPAAIGKAIDGASWRTTRRPCSSGPARSWAWAWSAPSRPTGGTGSPCATG